LKTHYLTRFSIHGSDVIETREVLDPSGKMDKGS
jgi:hypothetical protein